MSLLDKASLIITPNSYKESKLYSVVPNTTLGDMDVVRATTATRVNSAGLIEVVPRNLAQYSEAFDNGYWGKFNATITANNTTSPTGTSTADKIVENTVNSFHSMDSTFSSGTGIYTASIYAKVGERRYLRLNITEITPAIDHTALFDLQTGTLLSSGTGVTASIINAGNGWYRIILTSPALVGGQVRMAVLMQTTTSSTPQQYLGDGTSGLYLWGAQLEQGSTATEYFPTTTRLNIPRIDYTNGSCPSLLVEPQRTNLITYSEDFTISWAKLECSITSNTTNSPSGILTADSLIESTSNGRHMLYKPFASVIGTSYTLSVFCKQNTRRYANINFKTTTTASPRFSALFDLQTGTNVSTSSVGSPTGTSFSIVPYINGWYKISITMIAASISTELEISASNTSTPTLSEGSPSYLGNGTSGIFLWGSQLEAGSYATSYIPTIASTVTRNADVISKTGISSLIGQTEGTIFTEFNFTNVGTEKYIVNLKDVASSNVISFRRLTSGEIRFVLTATTSSGTTNQSTAVLPNGNYKIAYKYISGSIKIFINGSLLFTLTPTFTFGSAISIIELGNQGTSSQINDYIKQLQLYKTALTDQECINLTTL